MSMYRNKVEFYRTAKVGTVTGWTEQEYLIGAYWAAVAPARADTILQYSQRKMTVTNLIIVNGAPRLFTGDTAKIGSVVFKVQGVRDPNMQGKRIEVDAEEIKAGTGGGGSGN